MTEYQVYENEIKDGVFYVRHSDSVCEPVYFGEADDLPEPVEKPVEEPEVTSTEGASTGIPRLDQYTNVDETENTRWRILNDEPSSYTKSCYHYYCLCRIYKHPKEE